MGVGTISTYIQHVANLLKQKGVCMDVNPLKNALKKTDGDRYTCGLKLVFHPSKAPRNPIPSGVKDIRVILHLNIDEDFSNIKENSVYNTIVNKKYNCSILVVGSAECEQKDDILDYVSGLHIDYDSNSAGCSHLHPHFHLTFGGDKVKEYFDATPDADFGRSLLLSSPRIIHPPLDIFLAIDFILGNYFDKSIHMEIKKSKYYTSAIKSSQERLWKSHMLSLAGYWCEFKDCALEYDKEVSQQNCPYFLID